MWDIDQRTSAYCVELKSSGHMWSRFSRKSKMATASDVKHEKVQFFAVFCILPATRPLITSVPSRNCWRADSCGFNALGPKQIGWKTRALPLGEARNGRYFLFSDTDRSWNGLWRHVHRLLFFAPLSRFTRRNILATHLHSLVFLFEINCTRGKIVRMHRWALTQRVRWAAFC